MVNAFLMGLAAACSSTACDGKANAKRSAVFIFGDEFHYTSAGMLTLTEHALIHKYLMSINQNKHIEYDGKCQ